MTRLSTSNTASFRDLLARARDILFPRPCAGKNRYEDEAAARRVLRARIASGRDIHGDLYIYSCHECGGWHLTKHPQHLFENGTRKAA